MMVAATELSSCNDPGDPPKMEYELDSDDFKPRDYQIRIMEVAVQQNTIIYLPTGSGKTLIAVMILKRLAKSLQEPFSMGGKLSIMIVNTVTLVDQQAKYLRHFTHYEVGSYSGDMNVDSWNRTMWLEQFKNHQILVMTAQILVNLLTSNFLSLNQVNLLIFDECHNGVQDHAMRQIMSHFQNLIEEPRVVGLSATLLNKNCSPSQAINEVTALETTFHSKVATVEDLELVIGYSTNPHEEIRQYQEYELTFIDQRAIAHLNSTVQILSQFKSKNSKTPHVNSYLKPLETESVFRDLICLINDVIYHIQIFGTYIGMLAVIAHTIQIERLKKNCQEPVLATMYDSIITTFATVKKLLSDYMSDYNGVDCIYRYCSSQVLTLFQILKEYKEKSQQPLCGIIFVQRRFTAKLIYNVLKNLKEDPNFNYIEPNFMVGFNTNPFNDTREGLYKMKMNKKVLKQFYNKEINLLVASNILEEGVDIPRCTLVVSLDKVTNYRGYVQSKGRARHKDSFYYMVVDDVLKFSDKYKKFKQVEGILNSFLVGTNDTRSGPSDLEIQELYDEQTIPPYYVDGVGSSQVNLLTAVSLLCRYCSMLHSDKYTAYTPNWYVEMHQERHLFRVIIELPTISNILEPIKGPFMPTKKEAKRAAALKACEILHKNNELDDQLIPRPSEKVTEDLSYYFTHWSALKERNAGSTKKRRLHSKQIPSVCKGRITENKQIYLHLIKLSPLFKSDHNPTISMICDLYQSEQCFGILSVNAFPKLCIFPLYVTAGEISVDIKVNYSVVTLTEEQLSSIKSFHCLIFRDILKILKPFLVLDNKDDVDGLLVVPLKKNEYTFNIDFEITYNNTELFETSIPSYEKRKILDISEEKYLGKIVSPWYRSDDQVYVVTKLCQDMTAYSQFPSEEYNCYKTYYKEKYGIEVINGNRPLLLVKAISKRLNCLKPRHNGSKKGKEKVYDDVEEHLVPELCVMQNVPASLWIKSMLLPSILYRLISFLQANELRERIASESGLGLCALPEPEEWTPLVLDKHLMTNQKIEVAKPRKLEKIADEPIEDKKLPIMEMQALCKDFADKKLNNEYPWNIEEEPIDIERHLDVTLMDVQYFENFVSQKVSLDMRMRNTVSKMKTPSLPAITFNRSYVYKNIKLLNPAKTDKGPELVDIFTALTTAKSNDVVNLERLETLGDSFLKISISMFTLLRYPDFNEGRLSTFKGQLISNKNLYYIGKKKNIPGYIRISDFAPGYEWKPSSFCVPELLLEKINNKEMSINALFCFMFSKEEQLDGSPNMTSLNRISDMNTEEETDEEDVKHDSMHTFLDLQMVADKTVADSIEALLGVYFQCYGFEGGLHFLRWLEIIPPCENIQNLLKTELINPVLDKNATSVNIDYHLPSWKTVENSLGYTFKNRAYLLQALTHSSYTPNRITNCYQTLEFLGDAVLDFLITCHIFETCENLNPGDLTDLRSALVNNVTFAGFTVRCGFHKHLLFSNNQLMHYINNFVQYQELNNHEISEKVLILLEENDLCMAEHVDVPKVLGDTFEALAGAIFLDSGMCLETVWQVFHRIMWKEIELFKNSVPKNAVRLIHETIGAHPEFDNAVAIDTGNTMIGLKFMLNGAKKKVYGFGENKALAKKAAAKIALRLLHRT